MCVAAGWCKKLSGAEEVEEQVVEVQEWKNVARLAQRNETVAAGAIQSCQMDELLTSSSVVNLRVSTRGRTPGLKRLKRVSRCIISFQWSKVEDSAEGGAGAAISNEFLPSVISA